MLYGSVLMEKVPLPVALQNLAHAIPQGIALDEKTIQGLLLRMDRLLIDLTLPVPSTDTAYAIRILSLAKTIVRQVGRQDVAKNQLLCLFNACNTSSVLGSLLVYQPKDSAPSPKEAMSVLDQAYRTAMREGEEMRVSPMAWQSLKEHWNRCQQPIPDAERTLLTAKRLAKEDDTYMAQLLGRLLKYIEELERVWEVPLPPSDTVVTQDNEGQEESTPNKVKPFVLFDSHETKPS